MEASYQRIPLHKLQQVQMNSPEASIFFGYELEEEEAEELGEAVNTLEPGGPSLYIGKAWHGLHFLLSGNADTDYSSDLTPLGKVVSGGTAIEQESTYGPIRLLMPEEVKEVSAALLSVSRADLRSRLDASAFNAADIYPAYQEWKQGEMEWLLEDYESLVAFFAAAAAADEAMLLSMN